MLKFTLMMKVLPHAIKNWRITIIVLLCSFIWYQNNSDVIRMNIITIPNIQSQLDIAKDALDQSTEGNTKLADSLTKQNKEIQQWQDATTILEHKNVTLTNKINIVRVDSSKRVNDLLLQKTPQSCDTAFKLLSTGAREIQWND